VKAIMTHNSLPQLRETPILMAVLGLAALLPMAVGPYYLRFASKVLLLGMAALSLNLLVGVAGLVSLGHAAFFGLAGYVLALAAPDNGPASFWLTFPLAMGAVALAAAAIGALCLRSRGVYFIMATLAFGEMLFYLFHDTKIAGGSDGTYIYFRPSLGVSWIDLDRHDVFFWVVLAATAATVLGLRAIIHAPFGKALAASRENERRARSIGYPIYRLRLAAFVLSGIMAGMAGYFSAAQYGFVAPQMLAWPLSATLLVMVVLGGRSQLAGPLLGAAALLGLEEVLKLATEHWKLAKGLTIMAVVFLHPGALMSLLRSLGVGSALPGPGGRPASPADCPATRSRDRANA
jgi:branched-chain amino acid transport system permease protein